MLLSQGALGQPAETAEIVKVTSRLNSKKRLKTEMKTFTTSQPCIDNYFYFNSLVVRVLEICNLMQSVFC